MSSAGNTILIADHNPDVRAVVRQSAAQIPGMTVVGEASNGKDALNLLIEKTPEVAVLGVLMPVRTGKELIDDIRKHQIATRVLLLTAHDHPDYLLPSFWADAQGYVYTGDGLEEWIVPALRAVRSGRHFASPTPFESLRSHHARFIREQSQDRSLTGTETELLRLTVLGKSDKEMASALALPVRTVEKRKARLRRKFGVSTTVELAVVAVTQHLLEL